MPRRYFIKTFGCQMNEYDSSRMADLLRVEFGMEPAADPAGADVLILNTCSIREKAQEKVFTELGFWRPLKQARPGTVIAVGGCVASQEGAALRGRAPFVDVVFGPQTLHRLADMLRDVWRDRRASVDVSFPEMEKFDRLPEPRVEGPRAFVSVMEGCSKYCSFCVVPYTRGEEFSRPFDDVLAEVVGLAEQGVREVTLLGQNVNAYRGARHDGTSADLALLIRYVAEIEGIERIRFTTSHPVEFSDSLIDAFRDVPKLANHVHLPVQSGSDRILLAMKRGHTVADYKARIARLRAARPDICISSDFIVGFPRETEADFEDTIRLIEEIRFDQSYSFVYSARPGTPAAALADDTPPDVKLARLQRLQQLNESHGRSLSRAMVGSVQRVLVEGPARKGGGQWCGRTSNNRVVNFDAAAAVADGIEVRAARQGWRGCGLAAGDLLDVEITEAMHFTLRGRILGRSGGFPCRSGFSRDNAHAA